MGGTAVTPVPKPPKGTRNKASRHISNPRPPHYEPCEVEGCPNAWQETHEPYGASRRNLCIKHGLQAHLCLTHHRGMKEGVHGGNIALDIKLKRKYQAIFEQTHTREEFIALFGRNYLD